MPPAKNIIYCSDQPAECGFDHSAEKIEKQQVAQLVAQPIEVVEYHRLSSKCH
ncbi:MAG: hypothetical protein F6K26_45720 [Moorea sp. SIO2I5]|nr:hypothetical protein [Moorena sp. SIO2I5]